MSTPRAIRRALAALGASAVLVAGLLTSPLAAAQDEDCSVIRDANERLACFDRMFPRRNTPASPDRPAAEQETQDTIVTRPVPRADADAADGVAAQSTTAATTADSEPRRGFGFPKVGDIFSRTKPETIESRIAAVRAQNQQKMVFLLENDQIWIQSSPRDLPIREGDRVTVSTTTFGGYMMHTERGTTTRVSRIR